MRVIVDFSSSEEDLIWALKSHVRDAHFLDEATAGSIVLLDDTEGHTASGVIRQVDDSGLMEVEVLWQTWRDDSALRDIPNSYYGWTEPRMTSSMSEIQFV